jgi:membrane protein implicated in regulation of membrane protease activity
MTWLLKLSPALRWAIATVLAIIVLAAIYHWLGAREEADDTANQSIGAAVQREQNHAATIEQVRKANDAEQELRSDDAARRASCLRHSRTPENCR